VALRILNAFIVPCESTALCDHDTRCVDVLPLPAAVQLMKKTPFHSVLLLSRIMARIIWQATVHRKG
jgi:hypothetical protein